MYIHDSSCTGKWIVPLHCPILVHEKISIINHGTDSTGSTRWVWLIELHLPIRALLSHGLLLCKLCLCLSMRVMLEDGDRSRLMLAKYRDALWLSLVRLLVVHLLLHLWRDVMLRRDTMRVREIERGRGHGACSGVYREGSRYSREVRMLKSINSAYSFFRIELEKLLKEINGYNRTKYRERKCLDKPTLRRCLW